MDKSEFSEASSGSEEEVVAAPEKEEKAEIVKADKPKESAAAAGAQANTKPDPKKAGKPVVNRTVRVDIEKLDVLMNLVSELIIAKNSLVSASTTGGEQNDQNLTSRSNILRALRQICTSPS